jgi:hypothetical protein
MFYSVRRSWFASLACTVCLSAVASGQNAKPALGQIVRSALAWLGGIPVPSGGTVVSGDTLTTAKAGGALLKFSASSQLEVSEDTSVTLVGTASHLAAKLGHGTVTATVQASSYLAVETSGCRIEASEPTGASYSVTLTPGASATVTASHGSVSLVETATSTHRILPEGQSAACPAVAPVAHQEEGAPAPSQSAGQAPPAAAAPAHGSNTTLWLLLGGGAAAGVAAALAGHGGGGATASASGVPASPSGP